MIDLIQVGTVNRTPPENNPVKSPDNVQETAPSKALASQGQYPRIERRRGGRRRSQDRRKVGASRKVRNDRRKVVDRRSQSRAPSESRTARSVSRKGRIIDERV